MASENATGSAADELLHDRESVGYVEAGRCAPSRGPLGPLPSARGALTKPATAIEDQTCESHSEQHERGGYWHPNEYAVDPYGLVRTE